MPVDGAIDGRPADSSGPTTYKAHLGQTDPVMFGGGPKGFCIYTITLQAVDFELVLLPSGLVSSGKVQDLNVEEKEPSCPNETIPPTVAHYTFASASPTPGGMTLSFDSAVQNNPSVSLLVDLSSSSGIYTAKLTFHRIDQPADPELEWTVVTTVTLAAL
jgi:hypothetical protein